MEKWKKVCRGCVPFLAALIGMYMITFFCLIGAGVLWGILHYEQVRADGTLVANLFADEAWLNKVGIWISCINYVVFIIGFGTWYKKAFCRAEQKRKEKVFSAPVVFGCIVYGVSMQCFCSYALNLILPLFPKIYNNYAALMDSMGMGKGLLPLIYMGILAPIAEELIFRGLILEYEKRALPFWAANLIQALCFGIYHQNIVQFVYAFFIGVMLGYLYNHFDSLLFVIVVHGIINISGNLISHFGLFSYLGQKTEPVAVCMINMVVMLISYLFLVGRKNKSR